MQYRNGYDAYVDISGDAGMTQRKRDIEDGVLEEREAIRAAEIARRKQDQEQQQKDQTP